MFSLAHKALLQCDPEFAHDMTIGWLAKTQRSFLKCTYQQDVIAKPVSLWGLNFPNPVGLAAGLDKEGPCVDAFQSMGFGFVEVGTVIQNQEFSVYHRRMPSLIVWVLTTMA